jgi:hypothetical protein
MPKGQAPKRTIASMRTEVSKLYDKVDSYDAKVDSSMLLRIKRKVENTIGIGSKERKTLLDRISKLDKNTFRKKKSGEAKG